MCCCSSLRVTPHTCSSPCNHLLTAAVFKNWSDHLLLAKMSYYLMVFTPLANLCHESFWGSWFELWTPIVPRSLSFFSVCLLIIFENSFFCHAQPSSKPQYYLDFPLHSFCQHSWISFPGKQTEYILQISVIQLFLLLEFHSSFCKRILMRKNSHFQYQLLVIT